MIHMMDKVNGIRSRKSVASSHSHLATARCHELSFEGNRFKQFSELQWHQSTWLKPDVNGKSLRQNCP
jgi:hypothetical protein